MGLLYGIHGALIGLNTGAFINSIAVRGSCECYIRNSKTQYC